jgi:serine protease inhibitor
LLKPLWPDQAATSQNLGRGWRPSPHSENKRSAGEHGNLLLSPYSIEVRVDHPFLFAIQHVPSGTCLFLGRLTDPR